MTVALAIAVAAALALAIHIGSMALCARSMGICIRSVSYGVGPTLVTIGKLRIRALPLSGFVRLKDSREELLEPAEWSDAFNHQPAWKQVLLPLGGAMTLAAAGIAILGNEGWQGFVRGFAQVFLGAFSPFDEAQKYLASFQAFASQHGFFPVFGLVAVKLAAFNLLPFGPLNGGQALVNLLKRGRPNVRWEDAVARWGVFATLLLLLGWLLAICKFVLDRAG